MKENTRVVYIPMGIELLVDEVHDDYTMLVDVETGEDIRVPECDYEMYEETDLA